MCASGRKQNEKTPVVEFQESWRRIVFSREGGYASQGSEKEDTDISEVS